MQVWILGLCMESICSMDLVFCLYVCNVFIRFETSSQKDTKLGLRESQNVLQNAGFGTSQCRFIVIRIYENQLNFWLKYL